MKITEGKHNHNLTNILKVLLFSFIMLLPVGAIASKSLYVICNKNAKDSYYGETINEKETILITNENQLQIAKTYYGHQIPNGTYEVYGGLGYNIYVSDLTINDDYDTSNVAFISVYRSSSYILFGFRDTNNTNLFQLTTNDLAFNDIRFTLVSYTKDQFMTEIFSYGLLCYYDYNKYSYLDNAFYYAIDQIEDEPIFNWTKNTAIYTGINTMNTNLGINNQAISIILTYWLLMTAIYVIIDIVITAFTILTHILMKKAE